MNSVGSANRARLIHEQGIPWFDLSSFCSWLGSLGIKGNPFKHPGFLVLQILVLKLARSRQALSRQPPPSW